MNYLNWQEQTITDFSDKTVSDMYDHGYVFTRIGKGAMQQTRSVRINLIHFELTSENRRILRKGSDIIRAKNSIPYTQYSWEIGKIAKDFYDLKAGGAFSTNKIKELLTTEHNFNSLFLFSATDAPAPGSGYAICYENSEILHYCYPFYDLNTSPKDMGLIMMTLTIVDSKERGLKYVYLGSLQRPTDTYKLQFEGVEWFDGKEWKKDLEEAKRVLAA